MSASSPVYQRRRLASPDELARIPWLSLLSASERERIESQVVVGVAMPGDYVCRMGRSVTFWFGVIEGLLKMSTDSASGRTITLYRCATRRVVWRRHCAETRNIPLQHLCIANQRGSRPARRHLPLVA